MGESRIGTVDVVYVNIQKPSANPARLLWFLNVICKPTEKSSITAFNCLLDFSFDVAEKRFPQLISHWPAFKIKPPHVGHAARLCFFGRNVLNVFEIKHQLTAFCLFHSPS